MSGIESHSLGSRLMERIQILEDRQDIFQLLMTHPLAIDGGGLDFWLSKWTEDSVVDRPYDPEHHSGAFEGVYGKDVMHQEAQSPELAALRKTGICHFVKAPAIRLDGDTAHASNYLQLFTREDKSYRLRFLLISRSVTEKLQDLLWRPFRRNEPYMKFVDYNRA
ncbi:hypothetical protein B0A55_03115 [Friedmanniomyces simplex]|uniref:SnoaL-like domain-containing protein n=1 Tax=Friedmanniomyces simplex TaxID=329884 RepID=A0A4U0XIL1_9PEZI|nr:hypothetical protein B0A55_03115 [Friedmanniomyces simplex]